MDARLCEHNTEITTSCRVYGQYVYAGFMHMQEKRNVHLTEKEIQMKNYK